MQDQEIITLYWSRDEQALRETERQYGAYCMTVSMNILDSRQDAEECVNDAYLKTWNSIPPHKPSNLRTYLGKIVRNLSIDRVRTLHRSRRNRDLEIAMEELSDALAVPAETDAQELCNLLNGFLDSCERKDRQLFVARYWYGHKIVDIAAHHGMIPNTVSQHLLRTREKLKRYLEERGYPV